MNPITKKLLVNGGEIKIINVLSRCLELASKEEFCQKPWFLDQPQLNSNPPFLLAGDFSSLNCAIGLKQFADTVLFEDGMFKMMNNSCIFGLSKSLTELWCHKQLEKKFSLDNFMLL